MSMNLIRFKLTTGKTHVLLHSYVGTIVHLKTLFPAVIANLAYNRVNYEQYLFKSNKLMKLHYKTFSDMIPKRHSLSYIQSLLADVVDDMNTKLLKMFTVSIFDKTMNAEMETYTFAFEYIGSPDVTNQLKLNDVVSGTIKLLEILKKLSVEPKHSEEDIYLHVKIILV